MKLFVTRHGQTEWNAENRVCGVSDIALTAQGIEQAKELASRIAESRIDVIMSSPLIRAVSTAEIISNVIGKTIIQDHRLYEQNYGAFEGVARHDESFLEAKKHFSSKLAGGESIFQVVHRVYRLLDELKEKHAKQNVLLVTHGGICRVIHAYFNDQLNDEYHRFHMGNCEVREYNWS
ncbi:histidine phosphatase family protein [Paenibacillus sp. MMS18-CY102]|uniref:histidine phosphatase family protein n=1 Tax=Paenibacillus sp. MMS18-CY102 TaxID=2682849 RepID=UPI0013654FC4|nr:histidine phosphatase family protein [Paenibacillus sp. MMS18-CY102]MWC31164.1 histidine phosphatase family protein [Paenibacillus sp. MMS18-CY102]